MRKIESERGRRFTALFEALVRASAATAVGAIGLTACGGDSNENANGAIDRGDAAAVADGEVQDSADASSTIGDSGLTGDATTDAGVTDAAVVVDVDASLTALRAPLSLDACDVAAFGRDGGADAGVLSVPADAGTGPLPQFLAHATVSPPVDYLDARILDRTTTAEGMLAIAKAGNACADANAAACDAIGVALSYPFGQGAGPALQALGYVRAGAAGIVIPPGNYPDGGTPRVDASAFLGPVRTIPNAALIGYLNGHGVQCGPKTAALDPDGVRLATQFGDDCGGGSEGVFEARVLVKSDGTLVVEGKVLIKPPQSNCVYGRRPEGMGLGRATACGNPVGEYLAEAAGLEEASIAAFDRLVRELDAHGAPTRLVRRARAARADEVRHARTMQKLSRKYGGTPRRAVNEVLPARSLEAMALENVAEGCVRETFGALSATCSARNASDPEMRRAMAVIAQDETEHAALAWDVARWVNARLDPYARQRVEAARIEAARTLRRELETPLHDDVVRVIGLRSAGAAIALFDSLLEQVQAA